MELALIGSGGHAKEVMFQMGKEVQCFVTSEYKEGKGVFHIDKFDPERWMVMIAIGEPSVRKNLLSILPKETRFFSFIHPTALVGDSVQIGQGSFIGAYSILTAHITLGDHSILNRGCQIGHDSCCGNFLSMMPGSVLSGGVTVGNNFYLGTNSAVKEKLNICDDVKIGLVSSVVKNIELPGTYGGCPVKKL